MIRPSRFLSNTHNQDQSTNQSINQSVTPAPHTIPRHITVTNPSSIPTHPMMKKSVPANHETRTRSLVLISPYSAVKTRDARLWAGEDEEPPPPPVAWACQIGKID